MPKAKQTTKPAPSVRTGSGAARKSKASFRIARRTKWLGLAIFAIIFGAFGSYLIFASHADAMVCEPATISGSAILRCATPCPTGTNGSQASDTYYYCFGQATTALSNCGPVTLAGSPALICNFGCPIPTTGTMASDKYFYCFGTPAQATSCQAVTVSGHDAERCNGSCLQGSQGTLSSDGYYYCFKPAPTTTSTGAASAQPAPTNNCLLVTVSGSNAQRCTLSCPTGTAGSKASDGYYYCFKPTTTSSSVPAGIDAKPTCQMVTASESRCATSCPDRTTGGKASDGYHYCYKAGSSPSSASSSNPTGSIKQMGRPACEGGEAFGACTDPSAHNCGAHGQWKYNDASGCGCVGGYTGLTCTVAPSKKVTQTPQQACTTKKWYWNGKTCVAYTTAQCQNLWRYTEVSAVNGICRLQSGKARSYGSTAQPTLKTCAQLGGYVTNGQCKKSNFNQAPYKPDTVLGECMESGPNLNPTNCHIKQ